MDLKTILGDKNPSQHPKTKKDINEKYRIVRKYKGYLNKETKPVIL